MTAFSLQFFIFIVKYSLVKLRAYCLQSYIKYVKVISIKIYQKTLSTMQKSVDRRGEDYEGSGMRGQLVPS